MLRQLLLHWLRCFVWYFSTMLVETLLVSKTVKELFSSLLWVWVSMPFRMSFWSSQMRDQFSWGKQTTTCIRYLLTSGQRSSLSSHLACWRQQCSEQLCTMLLDSTKKSGSSSPCFWSFCSWFTTLQEVMLSFWEQFSPISNLQWHLRQFWSSHSCFSPVSSSTRTTFPSSWSSSSIYPFSSMGTKLSSWTSSKTSK